MMNYYESAEDIIITQDRALEELRNHNCEDFEEFFQDLGDQEDLLLYGLRSDTPTAVQIAASVRSTLEAAGITVTRFDGRRG